MDYWPILSEAARTSRLISVKRVSVCSRAKCRDICVGFNKEGRRRITGDGCWRSRTGKPLYDFG
ncbi:hypothetical protein BaRGS_00013396, partial [Batillaria attramentaria]